MRYVLLFLVTLTFSSCIEGFNQKKTKEGTIIFDIKYLEDERKNPLLALLPTSMQMDFKDGNTISRIEGMMGLFGFAYILDVDENKNSTLLQIFGSKYLYQVDCSQPSFGFGELDDMKIEYTSETKNIIGFDCKKAIVTYSNIGDTIELYYTHEIDIINPNSNNPFKDIDGVLLEFRTKLHGIEMSFKASKFNQVKISDDIFKVPNDYTKVNWQRMQEEINPYLPKKIEN